MEWLDGVDFGEETGFLTANDLGCIDTEAPQIANRGIRNRIFLRKNADIKRTQAELCQGYGHVGFAATEGSVETGALQEAFKTGRASRSMISPKVTVTFLIADYWG